MENQSGFLLKVFVLSLVISLLIKYAGPVLVIPATTVSALSLVFLPTILMAIALLWRFQTQKQN